MSRERWAIRRSTALLAHLKVVPTAARDSWRAPQTFHDAPNFPIELPNVGIEGIEGYPSALDEVTKEKAMGFEVFEKSSAPLTKVPTVTLQKRGTISINRSAHSLMDRAEFVELLWDRERRVVGFRPTEEDNPNAYPVRPQNSKTDTGPLIIAGMAFTKFYGIDTDHAARYVPEREGEIVCIALDGPHQRVTSNRNRAAHKSDNG